MKYIYWLVFGLISGIIYFQLPFHQDEFLHFSSLAYQQPNFALNQFKEGFAAYEKYFPGGFSVYFPFLYTGNLQGILLSPFYALLPIIEAKMAYSLLSLALIYVIIQRIFTLDKLARWFLFLLIPFYVAVLRDAGPVNVALLVFLLSMYFTEQITIRKAGWPPALILSFLWSLAFYDKLFFVYLMPSILVFSLARTPVGDLFYRNSLLKIVASLAVFGIFIVAYMLSDIGVRQFQSVELGEIRVPFLKAIASADTISWLEDRRIVLDTILAQFDFSFYVLRNLNYTDFLQFKVWGGLRWFGISLLVLILLEFKYNRLAKWYLASFIIMVLTFLVLGKIRFGHHTIFLFLPLLGFWFDGRRPKYWKPLLVWLGVNLMVFFTNIFAANPHESLKSDYRELVTKTKLSQPVIVNFDSWNYYYLRNLDADQAIVTWVDLRDSIQTNRLFALAKRCQRPIVNVSGSPEVWGQNWLLIQNRVDSVSVDRTFPANPISTLRVK